MSEPISVQDLLTYLSMAIDQRTFLVIGEVVKDGKRIEAVRKRSAGFTDVFSTAGEVLTATGRYADTHDLRDPDEIVVRILRPVKE